MGCDVGPCRLIAVHSRFVCHLVVQVAVDVLRHEARVY